MIREATEDDIPELVDMGKKFHEAGGLACAFNEVATGTFLERMIESGDAVVFRSDKGMIGGGVSNPYCDPDWRLALEFFWWSEDKQGVKLFKAFEEWARSKNADEIRMTTIPDLPAAEKIVKRRGYQPSEISYSRVT